MSPEADCWLANIPYIEVPVDRETSLHRLHPTNSNWNIFQTDLHGHIMLYQTTIHDRSGHSTKIFFLTDKLRQTTYYSPCMQALSGSPVYNSCLDVVVGLSQVTIHVHEFLL